MRKGEKDERQCRGSVDDTKVREMEGKHMVADGGLLAEKGRFFVGIFAETDAF